MNILTQSLAALSIFTGAALAALPAQASPQTLIAPSSTPAQDALVSLTSQENGPLPPGTRLLSINLVDGLATVNFSHELRDHFPGGDGAETRVVNSVLRTLGQFPTVTQVQFLVEGKPLASLGGLLDLSAPQPVLRPGETVGDSSRRYFHRRAAAGKPAK